MTFHRLRLGLGIAAVAAASITVSAQQVSAGGPLLLKEKMQGGVVDKAAGPDVPVQKIGRAAVASKVIRKADGPGPAVAARDRVSPPVPPPLLLKALK
ncbi:MAG: hypothetical protein AB3N09_01120 [Tateyamaria sp.]